MFTLWDRMFGTHVEVRPDDPPCLGTPKPYETHNGARAQWIGWRDLWHAAARSRRCADGSRCGSARPGVIRA
jgi:hypothetical protein